MGPRATDSPVFPVGYHRFHRKQLFNFQLNRMYSLGFATLEDVRDVGNRIRTFRDWKREMLELARKAEDGGRPLRSSMYYRAAEFYVLEETPEKDWLYGKFRDLFYGAAGEGFFEKHRVPYEDTSLPALRFPSKGDAKGTVVFHGGFDSFIEEFYFMLRHLSESGYETVAFEGPGQGAARRENGLAFDIEWEKPVGSVLDHFGLDDVTLIGMSMGGWLCLRAAAHEPRVSRVIASGHAVDYMKSMNPVFYWIHKWFFDHHRDFMERMAEKKFLRGGDNIQAWMVKHLMYITKKEKPLDALETYVEMNEENMRCGSITQDVLLLLGEKDHFIPLKMLDMQAKALTNARSVTTRVFRREEHARNHCQIGNVGLSLEVMTEWIQKVSRG